MKEITVKNADELAELMEAGSYEISKSIVNNIIKNLDTDKKHIHVVSIFCISDAEMYDLTLERNKFLETLEMNLPMFEKNEDYVGCAQIIESINQLKNHGKTINKPKSK